jgi:hypothetical protein
VHLSRSLTWRDPNLKGVIGMVAIAFALLSLIDCRKEENASQPPAWTRGTHRTYSTNFPRTESPISEGGNWTNGKSEGMDWSDVRTAQGLAFGTQVPPAGPPYNDSLAVLTGTWNPNQMVSATVHTVQQQDNSYEEVELLLRMSISPHKATGYEVNFRCYKGRRSYVEFHNWNGRLNDFGTLSSTTGPGLRDGDVVSASIVGSTITVWINGKQVLQGKDPLNRFTTGNPGMGFYYEGSTGSDSDYGFINFTASDET